MNTYSAKSALGETATSQTTDREPGQPDGRGEGARSRNIAQTNAILRSSGPAIQLKAAPGEAAPQAGGGGGGGGGRLPGGVQSQMERSFGADFSDVRVHQGGQASALGARAYAQGSDLHFAPGQYDPHSQQGQSLIGHELAHVVQQRAGRVATPQGKGMPINADAALEHEADDAGARAARGEPATVTGSSAGLQRKTGSAPIQLDKDKDKKKDALAPIHADKDQRADELADQFLKATSSSKKLEQVAMVLEGSPILNDAAMRKRFIKAYNKKANKQIDEHNETEDDLEAMGFGPAEHLRHVHHTNRPQSMDQIIDIHFKGNAALYLKQLAQDGRSNPLWKIRLALGQVEGWSPAASDEVFHLALEAPAELPRFHISLEEYWTAVDKPVKAKLDKKKYNRVAALFGMEMAHEAAEEAEEHEHEAQAKLGRAGRRVRWLEREVANHGGKKKKEALATVKHEAEEAVWKADEATKQVAKKQEAADQQALVYLAQMIAQLKDELNEMEPNAIGEIKEWTTEHQRARAAAVKMNSPVVTALAKHIKKERDRVFLGSVIKGDAGGALGDSLKQKGFHPDELRTDEVVGAQAIVKREDAKHGLGKGKHHTNLKSTLMGMSDEAREQYLAEVSGMTRDELKDRPKRHTALGKLSSHLAALGVKDKDAEEIAAMFRTSEVGGTYAKLRALVLTTPESKWAEKDFGKQAYGLVLELQGAEYYQVRSDHTMLKALRACPQHAEIKAVIGTDDQLKISAGPKEKVVEQARDAAELTPAHWAQVLGHELEKFAIPLPKVETRDRDRVYLLAHQAANAAHRASKGKEAPVTEAALFMRGVKTSLSSGASSVLNRWYGKLSTAIDHGDPITTDMVLGEVLYHDGKIGGVGVTFYHHIDVEHFTQTFEQCEGKELLDQWSNIQEFRDGMEEARKKGNAAEFKSQFVLDAREDRKKLIKDVVGAGKAPAVLKKLRERLRAAAEHDEAFKQELDDGGVNSLFHRERMGLRSSLEGAERRRKGWQMRGVSAKGIVDSQRRREVVGGGREAYGDLQEVDDEQEQDKRYKEKHQEDLERNQEGLERTGASFTALRAKVRKYTEIAITIAMMVIATAVAAAITGATYGAGGVTLAPIALMWAKFGVMIAAKLTAVAVAAVIKEAVGNQITGEEWDTAGSGPTSRSAAPAPSSAARPAPASRVRSSSRAACRRSRCRSSARPRPRRPPRPVASS